MYSRPAAVLTDDALAQQAQDLIRACVHCGFCLPACPTYRVTGNELDSPRGRIYLIKDMLERGTPNDASRNHLDRCLTCRACETACPSGVQYGRLADLGRELVEQRAPRPRRFRERIVRVALLRVATRRSIFTPLMRLGQWVRPVLPETIARAIPRRQVRSAVVAWPAPRHARCMTVLQGCVQPGLAPGINPAAARVLDRLGISLVAAEGLGCCGAMHHHLGRTEAALDRIRHNVRVGAGLLDAGIEAIVSTASGCGVFAKDYGYAMRHEPQEGLALATRVGAATRDLCEVIDPGQLRALVADTAHAPRVAWQAPCSLQHGQGAATAGKVEAILRIVGCELVPVRESGMCCGSAGTYSILQPELSQQLRARKLDALLGNRPDAIATANIGCLEHLRQASPVPVRHWIEIVDEMLASG
jgi:glycolate oxidase iron-sulfur subunit